MTWYLELLESSLRGDWSTSLTYGLGAFVFAMLVLAVVAGERR